MDPIAHTFTGAALAAAGLRRASPLASAALLIGANAPDVDVIANFGGDYFALATRRGWTHGVLALSVWPFLITGLLLAFARWRPPHPPVRAGPLLAVTALAVFTHPTLDWLNNYGMRWLMPLDGRWFYGDALFIIDPWVWLALGGVLFLRHSHSRRSLVWWTAFWLLGSALILATDEAPPPAKVLWAAALVALAIARLRRLAPGDGLARTALAAVALYMLAALGASAAARHEVRALLEARGAGPIESVMVAPAAANPFGGSVVAATPDLYYVGEWSWLRAPRLVLEAQPLPRQTGAPEAIAAAAALPAAHRFLVWSRFPYFAAERTAVGYLVRIRDARYRDVGRLAGPDVHLDADLEPVEGLL